MIKMGQRYAALHVASQEPLMQSRVFDYLYDEFSPGAKTIEVPSDDAGVKDLVEMVKSSISSNHPTFLILDLFLTMKEIGGLSLRNRNLWTPDWRGIVERTLYYEGVHPEKGYQLHFGPHCLTSYQVYKSLFNLVSKPRNLIVVYSTGRIVMPSDNHRMLAAHLLKDDSVSWLYTPSDEQSNDRLFLGMMRFKLEQLTKQSSS